MSVLDKVLRAGEGRRFRKLEVVAAEVNDFEEEISLLSDAELRAKTDEFRARLAGGEDLDDLLPEAFACVRETAQRTIGQRHFDVQVTGAVVLHRGAIAEMKTGEGKTLVATMPAYLNALTRKGVHIATVNPYLAKRDAEWMGGIYRFLGLNVGLVQPQMNPEERVKGYSADITYGTANEFGFDYLRDNMARRPEHLAQRGHSFAIVDEVDSILIDEARTPLIISGAAEESAKWYRTFSRIAPRLRRDDHYEVDEGKRTLAIGEDGIARVEEILGVENLYDEVHTPLVHYLETSLKAKELYRRDRDYMVKDGEVLIVDENTGRTLPGRRWQDGLHQAVEAKEGVPIQNESQTWATITLQKYFQMYDKLSGMTGTAMTQAAEFGSVYALSAFEVPTNQPLIRQDQADVIYKTEDAKWRAVTDDVKERSERGQPVLVGTISIEKSEILAGYLDRSGIPHDVLNAKNHEREAMIIAQAGRIGAVTVATNMAGRGVDILLGGNPEYLARQEMSARGWDNDAYLLETMPEEDRRAYDEEYRPIFDKKKQECDAEHREVVELGGLYVLGTERHDSRRIDNQLRGRSGRQGDPGESRFYISLEDDLMKYFATGFISGAMERLNVPEDVPIEAKMVSKAIERAQNQVESHHFDIRKNLLKYEEVMAKQREVIYELRRRVLLGKVRDNGQEVDEDFSDKAEEYIAEAIEGIIETYAHPGMLPEEWDWAGLETALGQYFQSEALGRLDRMETSYEELLESLLEESVKKYTERSGQIGDERFKELERLVFLQVLDNRWREHLYEMDHLRDGIGLRAYAQKDPLVEYQREAFEMFTSMLATLKEEFTRYMFHVEVARRSETERPAGREVRGSEQVTGIAQAQGQGDGGGEESTYEPARSEKIPRNAPCPCGSGRKYKKCHGVEA